MGAEELACCSRPECSVSWNRKELSRMGTREGRGKSVEVIHQVCSHIMIKNDRVGETNSRTIKAITSVPPFISRQILSVTKVYVQNSKKNFKLKK